MLIGVMSDSHDNIWNLKKAIDVLIENKVEAVIHCGDLCAPFIVADLDNMGVPVHVVFGNTDDRYLTPKLCADSKNVTHYGELAELDLDCKIAVTHYPEFANALASSGKYDAVFYGHSHKQNEEKIGNTLLINPGEVMGRLGKASVAFYDTKEKSIKFVSLD